jgi:hypothetical protein
VAYAQPASFREAFTSAQPTGPAGAFAPPPPPPLAAEPGGSLREAFAAAQPTGPQSPFAAPAPSAVQPSAARRGSPIIDPGIQPAAATVGLAVLIALAAILGRTAVIVPTVLLQAVTAAGWFRLNGMWPARQGIALAALGGFTADAAMLAASGGTAPAVLAGTLGGFFLLVLILQIFRPSNPDERFYALTVSASATLVTVLAGCYPAAATLARHGWSDGAVVTVGALAAGAATVVSAVPKLPAPVAFAAGQARYRARAGGLRRGRGSGPGLRRGRGRGDRTRLGRRGDRSGRRGVRPDRTPGRGVRLPVPLRASDRGCRAAAGLRRSGGLSGRAAAGGLRGPPPTPSNAWAARAGWFEHPGEWVRLEGERAGQPRLPGPASSRRSPRRDSTCVQYDVWSSSW